MDQNDNKLRQKVEEFVCNICGNKLSSIRSVQFTFQGKKCVAEWLCVCEEGHKHLINFEEEPKTT